MEYRKATIKEAQPVCDIVLATKARIYPHYYTQAVAVKSWNMKICLSGYRSIKRNYLLYVNACVQSWEGQTQVII